MEAFFTNTENGEVCMNEIVKITNGQVQERCKYLLGQFLHPSTGPLKVFGVPRGGTMALHCFMAGVKPALVEPVLHPEEAHVILDDIIDSGKTRQYYRNLFPSIPFVAVIDKKDNPDHRQLGWVQFPWEPDAGEDIQSSVVRMIEFLGEDPTREGLEETPARVVKSWGTLYGGYAVNIPSIFKTFKEGACDEMVLLRDIEFYSTCEHHMLPFTGRAHIGYVPNGKVVGVSKLARLLDAFARRLQIQERIGQQVTNALTEFLNPLGCACVIEAQHYCMTSRGVQKQNSKMVTSSLTGVFRNDPAARAEFYNLIKGVS
jgi:GTP cyclohydrolase I